MSAADVVMLLLNRAPANSSLMVDADCGAPLVRAFGVTPLATAPPLLSGSPRNFVSYS